MLEERPSFKRDNLFGGMGTVEIWDLLGQRQADPFTAVLWCRLEPDGNVGRHQQSTEHEILVCLSGRGQAAVDQKHFPLSPGEMVYLPLGAILALDNLSSDHDLSYLIIKGKAD